jgi:hypothetical protein
MQTQTSPMNRITKFLKEYGIPGVTVHFSLYFITWAGLYLGIDYGLIKVSDVQKLVRKVGLDKYVDMDNLENKKTATSVAIAWILTKFTQPLRIALTIAITPFIMRILRLKKKQLI